MAAHQLVINEVLARPNADEDLLIELHNLSDRSLDIGGWYISDSSEDLFRFQIDQGTSIAAGGYHVIDQQQLGSHFDIRGGKLWLTEADPNGRPVRVMDHVQFGTVAQGVSLGRWPTSDDSLIAMSDLTFGGQNSRPWVGAVILTEVHPDPVDADGKGKAVKADDSELIELYNRGDTPVDLSGWQLNGDINFTFRSETTIQAGESIVVAAASFRDRPVLRKFFNMESETQMMGQLGPHLPDLRGTVRLVQPLASPPGEQGPYPALIVDEIRYDSSPPWPSPGPGDSFARTQPNAYGVLPTSWKKDSPTPGRPSFNLIGDANHDGIFNSADLVNVFNAGKYNDGIPGNATFDEGDWNQDGDFDEKDIVEAFILGHYVPDAEPALRELAAAIDAAQADEGAKWSFVL